MDRVHHEARDPVRRDARDVHDAEHERDGEKNERDPTGGAGEIPERHQPTSSPSGQPATVTTRPSAVTSRAGSPRLASQSGASWPRRTAAVDATFASTHEAAATVTVLHTS